jgi:ferredoxin--NADP+ reductase
VTDIADHALEALDASNVKEIIVVGRRGPAQAAFTNPELRELGDLADADVIVDPEELERALAVEDPNMDVTSTQNVSILRDYAGRTPAGKSKRVVLRFLLSPLELEGDTSGVHTVAMVRNELQATEDGRLRAQPTGDTETIEAGLVMRAIGYRGKPLPGVPFDDRGATIPNEDGRIVSPDGAHPGEYAVGWIKRGPSGVIGTNKKDAQETVNALLEDLAAGTHLRPSDPDPQTIEALLEERVPALVTYEGWSEIDRHEQALGEAHGRPRVKLTRIEHLLQVAAGETPDAEPLDTLGLR